jgi:hypothetical protein
MVNHEHKWVENAENDTGGKDDGLHEMAAKGKSGEETGVSEH